MYCSARYLYQYVTFVFLDIWEKNTTGRFSVLIPSPQFKKIVLCLRCRFLFAKKKQVQHYQQKQACNIPQWRTHKSLQSNMSIFEISIMCLFSQISVWEGGEEVKNSLLECDYEYFKENEGWSLHLWSYHKAPLKSSAPLTRGRWRRNAEESRRGPWPRRPHRKPVDGRCRVWCQCSINLWSFDLWWALMYLCTKQVNLIKYSILWIIIIIIIILDLSIFLCVCKRHLADWKRWRRRSCVLVFNFSFALARRVLALSRVELERTSSAVDVVVFFVEFLWFFSGHCWFHESPATEVQY